jgi:hypothetical protein
MTESFTERGYATGGMRQKKNAAEGNAGRGRPALYR